MNTQHQEYVMRVIRNCRTKDHVRAVKAWIENIIENEFTLRDAMDALEYVESRIESKVRSAGSRNDRFLSVEQ